MYVYMTSGTHEFLKTLENKHSDQTILLMDNADTSVLVHETEGKSVFQEPRRYEVIDSSGDLQKHGFVVINNIPVSDEGRPVFEYRFKNRAGLIEEVAGFIAIRVLRPLDTDTYSILTQWEDEHSFKQWQDSQQYAKAHEKRGTADGVDAQRNMFPRPSFVTKYSIAEDEE
jgi:heme oxygenase (mycobilin-producing)